MLLEGDRWRAVDGPTDPLAILHGRLQALGPVRSDDPQMLDLEGQGAILRVRLQGQNAWCDRRLLARIHRYTLDRLRKEIEPVTAAHFLAFLACWQHVDATHMLDGPAGVVEVLGQLAGFEAPAIAWEASILPRRVRAYKREWLDQATLSGEFAWGRLWGSGACAVRVTPIGFYPRPELAQWVGLAEEVPSPEDGYAGQISPAFPRAAQRSPRKSRPPRDSSRRRSRWGLPSSSRVAWQRVTRSPRSGDSSCLPRGGAGQHRSSGAGHFFIARPFPPRQSMSLLTSFSVGRASSSARHSSANGYRCPGGGSCASYGRSRPAAKFVAGDSSRGSTVSNTRCQKL